MGDAKSPHNPRCSFSWRKKKEPKEHPPNQAFPIWKDVVDYEGRPSSSKFLRPVGSKRRKASSVGIIDYVDLERDSAMLKRAWHCSRCLLGSQSLCPKGRAMSV